MKVKMVFEMAKEPLYTIGCLRYFGIIQIVEHVGQGSFDGEIGPSQQFMGVPIPVGLLVICFLLQVILMSLIP